MKQKLLGLRIDELSDVAMKLGLPRFAGKQIAEWIYGRHATSIDEMTNISKAHRALLAEHCEIGWAGPIDTQRSKDGTTKYLFPVETTQPAGGGKMVETVFIPEEGGRATLCVSSQVGCKMNCLFCQTGKQGFEGNLTANDILNQVYALPERDSLTNIVFMGQGEPMDNLDNVLRATEILTADYGWAWSPKRITVSSVGVKNKLKRFLEESNCHIAISLHAPTHALRAELMPAERGMSIEEVVELLRGYDFSHQRRLSFEYIVFGGINDTPAHAREIVGRSSASTAASTSSASTRFPTCPSMGLTRRGWNSCATTSQPTASSPPSAPAVARTSMPPADCSARRSGSVR